jgi:hypothetical protein
MNRMTFLPALLGALLAAPGIGFAQDHDVEQLVIEMAHTPDQHRAVAAHYRAKAEEARKEARRHESMGRIYATQRSAQPQVGRRHCEKLAQNYESIAAEYEELAKFHDGEANNSKE